MYLSLKTIHGLISVHVRLCISPSSCWPAALSHWQSYFSSLPVCVCMYQYSGNLLLRLCLMDCGQTFCYFWDGLCAIGNDIAVEGAQAPLVEALRSKTTLQLASKASTSPPANTSWRCACQVGSYIFYFCSVRARACLCLVYASVTGNQDWALPLCSYCA